jgi:hypothetical protein
LARPSQKENLLVPSRDIALTLFRKSRYVDRKQAGWRNSVKIVSHESFGFPNTNSGDSDPDSQISTA